MGKMAVGFEKRLDFEKLRNERLQRTKDTMAQFGIDALITFDCDAQRYICDYFITTPCRKIEDSNVFPRKYTGFQCMDDWRTVSGKAVNR